MISILEEPRVQSNPPVTFVSRQGRSMWAVRPDYLVTDAGGGLGTVDEEQDAASPDWWDHFVEQLICLSELAPNWDSYGAPEIDLAALTLAARVAEELPRGMPEPLVNPTPAGGVQLEWHRKGANAEIEVFPGEETIIVYVEDMGKEDEDEGTLRTVQPLLRRLGELFAV